MNEWSSGPGFGVNYQWDWFNSLGRHQPVCRPLLNMLIRNEIGSNNVRPRLQPDGNNVSHLISFYWKCVMSELPPWWLGLSCYSETVDLCVRCFSTVRSVRSFPNVELLSRGESYLENFCWNSTSFLAKSSFNFKVNALFYMFGCSRLSLWLLGVVFGSNKLELSDIFCFKRCTFWTASLDRPRYILYGTLL